MLYSSTRNSNLKVSSATAIAQGISAEGGLFVPEAIPVLSQADFAALQKADYVGRAKLVLSKYLTDYTEAELDACVKGAYLGNFEEDKPAPLVSFAGDASIMELWHGPTCAFKDLALQILPRLLTVAAKKVGDGKEIVILVATSGDTGKAALEGFKDVDGTRIMVFYPVDGVSPMQKLQMQTQAGDNVYVSAIQGNFDDAQTGVKRMFTDRAIEEKLYANNKTFSSANSINWGRLVPQIVYYVSAYCDLLAAGKDLSNGFNVVVPTGNFGNILAAYYAKCMGVPVARLICASNANNVLTDFLKTGTYDRNRSFYATISPSMDILISSNLERLLYHLAGEDAEKVTGYMNQLSAEGKYTVDADLLARIQESFTAGYCDDARTKTVISKVFHRQGYLCDTHTAVAVGVYEDYLKETGDTKPTVIASTASPFKFSASVLSAIAPEQAVGSEFDMVETLQSVTGWKAPAPLATLKDKTPIYTDVTTKETMVETVLGHLGIS